jgi:hypothetical protein
MYRELLDAQEQVARSIVALAEALLEIVNRQHQETLALMKASLTDIIKSSRDLAELRPGPTTTIQ